MKARRESVPRSERLYPNQWRALRTLRNYRQSEVAKKLGHENVHHYQDIEYGKRFPKARILFLLLELYQVNLKQAYPALASEAEETLRRLTKFH